MRTLLVITGPTACGKTATAVKLAKLVEGEVVSADSKQIYRRMDIGTAKPSAEETEGIPHHMLDIAEPGEYFSAEQFRRLASAVIDDIYARSKTPILAGGTGFYINAAVYENALDRAEGEPLKPRYNPAFVVLNRDRAALYAAIDRRVDEMVARGLTKEIEELLVSGVDENSLAMQALGYKEMLPCLRGERTLDEAIHLIKQGSRRYAKRQLTWFRHQLKNATWLDMDNLTPAEAAYYIKENFAL